MASKIVHNQFNEVNKGRDSKFRPFFTGVAKEEERRMVRHCPPLAESWAHQQHIAIMACQQQLPFAPA